MSASDDRSPFNTGPDPGPDHERVLREIGEAQPRFGCLGCVVSGGWAVAALVAFVVAIVLRGVLGTLGRPLVSLPLAESEPAS